MSLAFSLLFLLLLVPLRARDSPFSPSLASRFSLHTAYRNVYRQRIVLPPKCRPVAVSGVLRSGTAVPDSHTIQKIAPLLLRLRFESGPDTRARMSAWKSSFHLEDSDRLTAEGQREADHIGARLQRLLRPLGLNATSCRFAAEAGAGAVRLKEAAEAFSRNFGSGARVRLLPQEDLPLYAPCGGTPTARAAVTGTGEDHVRRFREGREMRYRLKKFNERHRLETAFSLDDFLTAFQICEFDTAADYARTSPWCQLFTKGDVYAIEFLQDLKFFWRGSYGRATNVLPACGIASKIMKMLKAAEKSSTKGEFFFTEAGTFLSLLSLLRIVRIEGALRAEDFTFAAERQFRSSHLVPFSANLVLVLLRCPDEQEPLLLPLLNENRRSWANCSGLCPLRTVSSFLSPCSPQPDALCLASRSRGARFSLQSPELFGLAALLLISQPLRL